MKFICTDFCWARMIKTHSGVPLTMSKQKSNNLQYNRLGHCVDGMSVSIDQVSDVPSIIFCQKFLQNSLQKFLQNSLKKFFAKIFSIYFFIFYNFTKIKIKSFECPNSKPETHCFIFNLSK